MKGCYSYFWILYSLARHSWPGGGGQTTAAEFFVHVLRLKPDTEIGPSMPVVKISLYNRPLRVVSLLKIPSLL